MALVSRCILVVALSLNVIAHQRVEWTDQEFSNWLRTFNTTNAKTKTVDLEKLRSFLIFPGTKWCGAGNIASGYKDLGDKGEADECCRQHDHCSDIITSKSTRHNLTNESYFTRLHCACDDAFMKCLKNAGTSASQKLGIIYFNAIGHQCYRKDYPIKGCNRRGGWFGNKCLEYVYDTSGRKIHQWFSLPDF